MRSVAQRASTRYSIDRMRGLLLMLACLTAGGCIRVAGSVAKPTALERQLLGEYERLDDELVHASSVRGDPSLPPDSYEAVKAEAIEQRAIQRFNEDDLLELKNSKCIAETLDATVIERPCAFADKEENVKRRLVRVVREENRARSAIVTWAAHEMARRAGRAAPAPAELQEVRKTYQRLLREAAAAGQLSEVAPGDFREVAK